MIGLTQLVLKAEGKMPDDKEVFIMSTTGSRITSKHSFRIIVGKGSNEHDLVDDFLITDSTWDGDTKSNLDSDEQQDFAVRLTESSTEASVEHDAASLITLFLK